ncbi:hypothetical protein E6O75_ATG10911 [Venturia nashicola]|uniref:Uncharacterized protein n=1 Tax=Venturia nashicola TaxID=86259 RepID=A0A4Z1P0Z4_9PEZI|nr:hypothetical protein E6O75_ATG10911 [Venturia nashicola]
MLLLPTLLYPILFICLSSSRCKQDLPPSLPRKAAFEKLTRPRIIRLTILEPRIRDALRDASHDACGLSTIRRSVSADDALITVSKYCGIICRVWSILFSTPTATTTTPFQSRKIHSPTGESDPRFLIAQLNGSFSPHLQSFCVVSSKFRSFVSSNIISQTSATPIGNAVFKLRLCDVHDVPLQGHRSWANRAMSVEDKIRQ